MNYRALDFGFTLVADPPLTVPLQQALAALEVARDGTAGDPAGTTPLEVRRNGDTWWIRTPDVAVQASTPGAALARTLELINQRAAASLVGAAPLHAAAVRHPDGGVLVLAGRSGSGKSTLSAAAILHGWQFVAEEVAAVDSATQLVRAYRRPIGLRRGGAEAIGFAWPSDPADVFSDVYPWPVPDERHGAPERLAAIALVSRSASSGISDVRPAAALSELVEHTVVPRDDDIVDVFGHLDELVRTVPVVRLSYDTPSEGLGHLAEIARSWG